MAKHHLKTKHKGEGVKLVGSPKDLVNLMVPSAKDKKWVVNELVNEGPKHKQVLNALLLKRLYKLVETIEKSRKVEFALHKGHDLMSEDKKVLPIQMPIVLSPATNQKKVAKAISHAPEHEALAYAMCIQVIEWAIKNTAA